MAFQEPGDVGERPDGHEMERSGDSHHGLGDGFDARIVVGRIERGEVGSEVAVRGDAFRYGVRVAQRGHGAGEDGDVGDAGARQHFADEPFPGLDASPDSGDADEVDVRMAGGTEERHGVVYVGSDVGIEPYTGHGVGIRRERR